MKTRLPLPGRRVARAEALASQSRDGTGSERPRRRRLLPITLAVAALAGVGIGTAALLGGDGESGGGPVRSGGQSVAVTRQTLVQRETVEGTLGYEDARAVLNRLEGSGGGAESPASSDPGTAATEWASASAGTTVIPAAYMPQGGDEAKKGGQPQADAQPQGADQPGDAADTPGSANNPRASSPSAGSPSAGSRPTRNSPAGASPSGEDGSDPDSDSGSDPGSGGSTSGTVTALARPGSVVRRGGILYRLDGEAVVLMYGSTPAYRELGLGVSDGRDVRQLERNLAALDFDPGTIDESFTSSTAAAVSDWQESAGLPETGSVELGRVVFLPGARRIGEHKTEVGSVLAASAEVLDTSSTRRVVTIELDAALQSIARKGDGVEVILPDDSTVRGRITEVGRVAREKDDSGSGDPAAGAATGAEQELVIDVTVRLRSARGLGRLDEAPVSVGLAQESRKNVLAVPVEALLARRGGGYAVELAAGGRIAPVRTGLFAGGYVEVSGAGIREGTRVVVPGE
jgi:peptidoglycan hydrolase-like protein with peptidoglycan-binding domain